VDREVLSGAAVALALAGPLEIQTVVAGGWQALGDDRVITRASDSKTIAELDGVPALSCTSITSASSAATSTTPGSSSRSA
jgi:hypothetical protein